jgi:hypothetical protein
MALWAPDDASLVGRSYGLVARKPIGLGEATLMMHHADGDLFDAKNSSQGRNFGRVDKSYLELD